MSELIGNIDIESPTNSESLKVKQGLQDKIDLQSDSNSLNEPVFQTIVLFT